MSSQKLTLILLVAIIGAALYTSGRLERIIAAARGLQQ